jgi:cytochrome b pre-mRNA-processing protein 3
MIFGLFRRPESDERTRALYAAIVAQARQPVFYAEIGVPDTLEGRYEMLMLHAFLFMHRLKGEPAETRDVGQKVFDMMFADMDRSLREIGVGDLSVPKKIKKMASAFYGRTAAYDAALAGEEGELAAAVERNVFAGDSGKDARAAQLAAYMRSTVDALAAQPTTELVGSGPAFPVPAVSR